MPRSSIYKKNIDFDELQKHEAQLCTQLIDGISALPHVRVLGPVEQLKQSGHLVSFVVDGMHPHDVAAYLDQHGICVRAGHQCAQPLAHKLGVESSVRVSFYAHNTMQEVNQIISVLRSINCDCWMHTICARTGICSIVRKLALKQRNSIKFIPTETV